MSKRVVFFLTVLVLSLSLIMPLSAGIRHTPSEENLDDCCIFIDRYTIIGVLECGTFVTWGMRLDELSEQGLGPPCTFTIPSYTIPTCTEPAYTIVEITLDNYPMPFVFTFNPYGVLISVNDELIPSYATYYLDSFDFAGFILPQVEIISPRVICPIGCSSWEAVFSHSVTDHPNNARCYQIIRFYNLICRVPTCRRLVGSRTDTIFGSTHTFSRSPNSNQYICRRCLWVR